jgi:hypothetical protein
LHVGAGDNTRRVDAAGVCMDMCIFEQLLRPLVCNLWLPQVGPARPVAAHLHLVGSMMGGGTQCIPL